MPGPMEEHVSQQIADNLPAIQPTLEKHRQFTRGLESLLNVHSMENGSNTPDFILARYLDVCLTVFDETSKQRETWYGRADSPGAPNAKEIHLMDIYKALGVEWGADPFAVIIDLKRRAGVA